MSLYTPPKFRFFGSTSSMLRGLVYLLRHWFLILIIYCIVSPKAPHILVWYSYTSTNGHATFYDCTYLGGRGFIREPVFGGCPFIQILEHEKPLF